MSQAAAGDEFENQYVHLSDFWKEADKVIESVKIIPVLDLMQGRVVHAVKGRRENYRPLSSPLCPDADPRAVVEAFRNLYRFDTFYIADLDALMGLGCQNELIAALRTAFPDIVFWLDRGLPEAGEAALDGVVPVIGSESLPTVDRLQRMTTRDWILSLDFFDGTLKGCSRLLAQPQCWPEKVIVMTLNRVGSFDGPDLDLLDRVRRLTPHRALIAAGGVRDAGDLEVLERRGIHAVLVASALHSGSLELSRLGSVRS
ncbi:HisA/HisF-related TIM barrel protein [Methylococcus capsulatus]|jgi:phosphoribosylformimino-5-aminoimidazole carboxamide ribotide isomerase|uniref:HisA/HisF family protein n=1 Tax=Methylococcus capsulatus TaxID=414 RepID=A0AA35UQR0_METCP|nr:HisA/HisF-related TIM barrel protein [Methylococcus capsulatus]CAI8806939.1 putative HisA/HisF family protein [Methylococcus capsulatus]